MLADAKTSAFGPPAISSFNIPEGPYFRHHGIAEFGLIGLGHVVQGRAQVAGGQSWMVSAKAMGGLFHNQIASKNIIMQS